VTRREPHFGDGARGGEPVLNLSTRAPGQAEPERRRGRVKHYSREKGFGFIHDYEEGVDRYFQIRAVRGGDVPGTGDIVTFVPAEHKRGPRAEDVVVQKSSEEQREDQRREERPDYRERCRSCGKLMVPRMSFYRGSPEASYCPFCGAQHKKFGACFIATAVYGDPLASEVDALRYLRDNRLMTSAPGRVAVRAYYRLSPPIADFLATRPRLSRRVRAILDGIVGYAFDHRDHKGSS